MLSPKYTLPIIEQPIMTGFPIDTLETVLDDILDRGEHAGAVVRRSQFDDDIDALMTRILRHKSGVVTEVQNFNRTPLSTPPTLKERIHLDIGDNNEPEDKITFPYSFTIARIDLGSATFVAAAASSRIRAINNGEYAGTKKLLNTSPRIEALRKLNEARPGSNITIPIGSKNIRGPIGALSLGLGDVVIIPQGGTGSVSPSWHAVLTPLGTTRQSTSHHVVVSAGKESEQLVLNI